MSGTRTERVYLGTDEERTRSLIDDFVERLHMTLFVDDVTGERYWENSDTSCFFSYRYLEVGELHVFAYMGTFDEPYAIDEGPFSGELSKVEYLTEFTWLDSMLRSLSRGRG